MTAPRKVNKAEAIAALKAGAVLRSTRIGSAVYATLVTADGRDFRVTKPTFAAILAALGPHLSITKGLNSTERRFVADPSSPEPSP